MPRIITAAERGNNKLLLSFAVVVASAKAAPAEAMDSGLALFRDVFQGLLELLKFSFTHVELPLLLLPEHTTETEHNVAAALELLQVASVAVAVCINQHLSSLLSRTSKLDRLLCHEWD